MATTGTKAEIAFIRKHNRSPFRLLMSSGLTPLASQTSMAWSSFYITVVPTVARISAPDAVRSSTTIRRIRWPSLSVVPSGLTEPGLLEAVPSLNHCAQQSCTVDSFCPSFSAMSRKVNPSSCSPYYTTSLKLKTQ
ncbi:uncharacterized protein TNCV_4010181 [Trichonephila clavipes]|nr:uncharacterized protein TNCV_4010181 [Trichonephila clavipes]